MKHFTSVQEISVDLSTINKLLAEHYAIPAKKNGKQISADNFYNLPSNMNYYHITADTFRLKISNKIYYFNLVDGSVQDNDGVNGMRAYNALKKSADKSFIDLSKVEDEFWKTFYDYTAGPMLWYNKSYERQVNYCYQYDVNSAYSFAMLKDMPDIRKGIVFDKEVEDGEIGFIPTDYTSFNGRIKVRMILPEDHEIAYWVFKTCESPFKKFVYRWYERKKNAPNSMEKKKAKRMLNLSIGELQNKTPFYRWAIIEYCNRYIKAFKDENTIYCNTDCIVSLTERKDLPIGEELGQFKVEHNKELFKYIGLNYQWENNIPIIRGKSKAKYLEGWDIYNSDNQNFERKNKYTFDRGKIKYVQQ